MGVTGAGEKIMTWDFTNKTICMIKEKCLKRNGGCDGVGRVSGAEAGTHCPKCHMTPAGTLGYQLTDKRVEGETMEWIKKNTVGLRKFSSVPVEIEGTEYNVKRCFVKGRGWSNGFKFDDVRFFLIPKSYDETPTESPGKKRRLT